ncbi:eukaryotic translation initiation factor 3 subunit B [Ditylenchus destructor]|nr:eukaryotic translation initiation factor 3 subunit B [Ditylenchus destructor]
MAVGSSIIAHQNGLADAEVRDEFSDPEGFVDDLSDSEIFSELDVVEPNESQYEERCLMVFGIPVCGQDRLPKLKNVLGKIFSIANPDAKNGADSKGYNDVYPLDNEDKTKGFCFLEYPSKESAEYACVLFDGYVLDKNHTVHWRDEKELLACGARIGQDP